MIMVFCRLLLLCIRARREEGKEARTTDARKAHGRTATQAYKGRNLIPFFHPLLSLSLSGFFVLPSSLSLRVPVPRLRVDVAVFLSLLSRPRDNDPELSKHHRRALMEIESRRNASFRSASELSGAIVEDRFRI